MRNKLKKIIKPVHTPDPEPTHIPRGYAKKKFIQPKKEKIQTVTYYLNGKKD